jgi:hexosaminidase
LWQLLTPGDARVRCVHIEDYPRFVWRGLMLDSARHFQSPEFVKKFIDEMAIHKLNVMHWHLTDDQGWRIEIKKYPKLTDIGAWRTPAHVIGSPARYGGFYTQDQIRDIVKYAADRYITIVPEIEMHRRPSRLIRNSASPVNGRRCRRIGVCIPICITSMTPRSIS